MNTYVKPDFSTREMELESSILDGSFTNQPIKVATVTVQDYDDAFAAEPNPFKDIDFD